MALNLSGSLENWRHCEERSDEAISIFKSKRLLRPNGGLAMTCICLSIETTGRYLGLALHRFEKNGPAKLLRLFFKETPLRQSELLIPTLKKLMRHARVSKHDLALIAVDVGPGSFTGVRVGLAASRALAQGLNLPLVGVSSLEAMAWGHVNGHADRLVVPRIPVLAKESFFAAYLGRRLKLPPCWEANSVFEKFLSKNKNARIVTDPPTPSALAEIAIERYQKNPRSKQFYFENVMPMYLQPSWAERSVIPA